jgi:hypothetical protein
MPLPFVLKAFEPPPTNPNPKYSSLVGKLDAGHFLSMLQLSTLSDTQQSSLSELLLFFAGDSCHQMQILRLSG